MARYSISVNDLFLSSYYIGYSDYSEDIVSEVYSADMVT